MVKLSFDSQTAESRKHYATMDSLRAHQVAIFVMVGGGLIGHMFAQQPADAYIDARCGRMPFGKRAIEQARRALVQEAEILGLDPKALPSMPQFHNCGVF